MEKFQKKKPVINLNPSNDYNKYNLQLYLLKLLYQLLQQSEYIEQLNLQVMKFFVVQKKKTIAPKFPSEDIPSLLEQHS